MREIRHKLQKMCKKMHGKQNTQGFTLVELIVVLTILTILAMMLIPTLQGYLEKTLETADVAEVRQAYMDVLTASLTGDSENMTQTVKLRQKEDDWQSMDPVTIAGITHSKADGNTANWIGIPTAAGVRFLIKRTSALCLPGRAKTISPRWLLPGRRHRQ